jgi:hypothetical protein
MEPQTEMLVLPNLDELYRLERCRAQFVCQPLAPKLQLHHMIRALLLIINPSSTWEAIKNEQPSVARTSFSFLLPLLLLSSLGEAWGLLRLGVEQGPFTQTVGPVSEHLALRYALVQAGLSLLVVYAGAAALKLIGASFHRRHSYSECFTTLAFSLSPLFLIRLLDAVPAVNTWVCYGIGIFLTVSLLYRGIPFILKPDPSSALGLFMICSFLLVGTTALAHFVTVQVLEQRILA